MAHVLPIRSVASKCLFAADNEKRYRMSYSLPAIIEEALVKCSLHTFSISLVSGYPKQLKSVVLSNRAAHMFFVGLAQICICV